MNLPDTRPMSPEEYDALLAAQDWGDLSKRLTEFAWRKMNRLSWEDAEDIAQGAIRRVFDPSRQRWNPRTQPNIFWFLGSIANGLISNRRRHKIRGVEVAYEQEDLEDLAAEGVDATDEVIARRARAKLIIGELKRRVAGDRAATLVLSAYEMEVDDPTEQARTAELTMHAVYKARSRLRAVAEEIAQTFDEGTPQ